MEKQLQVWALISPDVSDLTPDGVRASERASARACVRACVCVNSRQQLRSNGASVMA